MKQFLIIGNINALTYKEIFPYIKDGIIKYRPQRVHKYLNGAAAASWYTTLTVPELPPLELTKAYNPMDYPKYDNYDAIEVSRTKDIPYDYEGVMGVPITFLDHYNPSQFEIVKFRNGDDDKDLCINGKCPYTRILIKKKEPQFEIVGIFNDYKECDYESGFICGAKTECYERGGRKRLYAGPCINGKTKYVRILIRRIKN